MSLASSVGLAEIQHRLRPLRERLFAHDVYRTVDSLPRLRAFMERHVFAVWDFMSLLKELQRQLTCVEVPWLPAASRSTCRLVNEIVLGEESDADGRGGFCSHFELYVDAMTECGADVGPINKFTEALRLRTRPGTALAESGAPPEARRFTAQTLRQVDGQPLWCVAAAFTFGREDVVPEMFRRIVAGLAANPAAGLERFCYYLDRHIEVDEESHGPMALAMLDELCGTDAARWNEAYDAAAAAIAARIEFWDGVSAAVRAT